MTTATRRTLWGLAVVLAFIIGYLLGRRKCVKEMAAGGGGNTRVVAMGAPSSGDPSHIKLGGGQGTASSSGGRSNALDGGVDTVTGDGGKGGGGDADAGGGGGSGVIPPGGGEFKKVPTENDSLFGRYVARLAQDRQSTGDVPPDSAPPDPRIVTRVAHDFSFDATGLPRYPNTTRVVSGVSTRPDMPADTGTAAGMETRDSYQTVNDWYRQQMPPDWHQMDMGNLEHIAKRFSAENIGKMLMAAARGDTTPAADTTTADSTGQSVAIWTAPDNDNHHNRSLMVTARPGTTTQVVMTRSVRP